MQYGLSFYRTGTLTAYAKAYLKVLPKDVNVLISSGSSGCTIASAMLCFSKRPLKHIYIPKSTETRHFLQVLVLRKEKSVAIVDDFICNGETIQRIIDILISQYKVGKSKIYVLTTTTPDDLCYDARRSMRQTHYIPVEDIENNDIN